MTRFLEVNVFSRRRGYRRRSANHSHRKEKLMVKSSLLLSLVCLLGFGTIASAQTSFYLMESPTDGVVRPIAGNSALLYVGTESSVDSFLVAAEDANGFSLVNVDVIGGAAFISSVDFGGPMALSASTMLLSTKGGNTATPNAPASRPAAEEDKPFVVIIHVDQPGEGGDRHPYEGNGITSDVDVGHTFIEVINGETGETTTVGLYPANRPGESGDGVGPWDPEDPGIIRDDSDHPWDVRHEIEITEEQYNEIIEQINEDRQNPPDYELNDCNCTDYVLDLLEDVGIVIESQEGTWPGGGGHNPGDLGEDLEDLGGERNPNPADGDGSSK